MFVMISSDFGKSTDANKLELENLKETVVEIPIESEKEESEQETDEQSEPLRRSQRISTPPVRYGIDEFTNTANVTSHIAYQAVKIEELMMPSIVIMPMNGKKHPILSTAL